MMQNTTEKFIAAEMEQTPPILGQIMIYEGESVPAGWLPCDHRMLLRDVHPKLFRVIGTQYGDGDGSNTAFNLPNMVSPKSAPHYIIFVGTPHKNDP